MLTEEQVKLLKGLSEAEADERIKTSGYNELPSSKKKNIFLIVFGVVKEPMFLLLVSCGMIYLLLGETGDALLLLGFVFVMMGITIYQEEKTEKAVEALKELSSPRALVIRDGNRRRIAGREVVTDDIVIVAEGDRIPADAVLLWSRNLTVDESLLTGESVPVRKYPSDGDADAIGMGLPGGDNTPFVYSSTLVVQGQGVALVKAIGAKTQVGKIGRAIGSTGRENTMLQKETARIVRYVFLIALTFFAVVVVVYALTHADWFGGLLAGITLAMALLPEEFPVVLTIFLALGAWRISKKRVLTRRTSAIETLGAATVLCSDKTGTITQNRMSIKKLFACGKFYDVSRNGKSPLPDSFHPLIEFAILASKKDPFDPMEKALTRLGKIKLAHTEHLHADWKLVHEYPITRDMLALSHVWESRHGGKYIVSAKGAPESIIELCHMDAGQADAMAKQAGVMAEDGMRVLGVAKSYYSGPGELPGIQHDFTFEFLGLIGLEDPIRPAVPEAVSICYQAGIRTIMITGDYPKTAQNIAKQIGLNNPSEVITGPELEKMEEALLRERIKTVNIFARVVPEQKLMLVKALKANREIVAMTGDGVNDAPALKSAHIGVAMGERGTDVARESADLVLLDDDFSSIVAAVRLGRRIFDNLKKAMAYIVSVHIPIAAISLVPVIFRWDGLILLPAHIVFLELIIDPACSIVFEAEPEEADIMRRMPRDPSEPLFGRRSLAISLMQGSVVFVMAATVFRSALYLGQTVNEARTLAFIVLIVSNLGLILTNRSWSRTILSTLKTRNRALAWVICGAVVFLAVVVYMPFFREIFHFAVMHADDILISAGLGAASVLWFELLKMFSGKRHIELLKEKT